MISDDQHDDPQVENTRPVENTMQEENTRQPKSKHRVGRNEPCPCGSGKKFKRCHGQSEANQPNPDQPHAAQPHLLSTGAHEASALGASAGNLQSSTSGFPGMPFDPSQIDPQILTQISHAIQRLPRGQLQKMQSIFQQAMAGKDVTHEAALLEKMLPPDFKNLMQNLQTQLPWAQSDSEPTPTQATLDSSEPQSHPPEQGAKKGLGEKLKRLFGKRNG